MPRLPALPLGLLLCAFLLPKSQVFAQESEVVFSETFDGIVSPSLPPGWRSSGSGWATDDLASSDGSGANNLTHAGIEAGMITTPSVDLSSLKAGTLSYAARRSSTYGQDRLALTASVDGGLTFPIMLLPAGAALPVPSSSYAEITAPLPDDVLGQSAVVLRFEALGGDAGTAIIRIDDIQIEGTAGAVIALPPSLTFSADVGATQSRVVTVENTFERSVQLSAPEITGLAYTVTPEQAILLLPGATQAYTVSFSPLVEDAFSGKLAIPSDLGEITVPLLGSVAENVFGFTSESSTAIEGVNTFALPLSLDYRNATALQGLEFTMAWDTKAVSLTEIERGGAVANADQWTLTYEAGDTTAHVVMLDAGATGLAASAYDSLLILKFSGNVPDGEDAISIHFNVSNLTGSLAVPTGDDAVLTASSDRHTLTLQRRVAFFQASETSVDFGTTEVGQATAAGITVQNNAGTGELRVARVASNNSVFSITPTAAIIAPGTQQPFTIVFSPTDTAFGQQVADLVFSHDGEGGSDTVRVNGLGKGGRGDGFEDGMVEALDLVYLLDFAVGRTKPDEQQQASSDVYPFPMGDRNIDVHDATVLSQAIVNGVWPDEVGLPEIRTSSPGGGKDTPTSPVLVGIKRSLSASDALLYVQNDVPLLALQLTLKPEGEGAASKVAVPGVSLLGKQNGPGGILRLLLYSSDGRYLETGSHNLARLQLEGGTYGGRLLYATAIDTNRARISVSFDPAVRTGSESSTAVPEKLALGLPYPQPFAARGGTLLSVPMQVPDPGHVRLAVYDLMGRKVAVIYDADHAAGRFVIKWNGQSATGASLPAGLYLLRLDDDRHARTRKLVVVH